MKPLSRNLVNTSTILSDNDSNKTIACCPFCGKFVGKYKKGSYGVFYPFCKFCKREIEINMSQSK